MPLGIHPLWLLMLFLIVLIIFGPGKLGDLGGALGKGIKEFRRTTSELSDEISKSVTSDSSPAPPAAPSAPAQPAASAAVPETEKADADKVDAQKPA